MRIRYDSSATRRWRIRCRVFQQRWAYQVRKAHAMLIVLLVVAASSASTPLSTRVAAAVSQDESCNSRMILPIRAGSIIRAFVQPANPYGAGHRGVDIAVQTPERQPLIAPIDGTISFAGTVAGKAVVSITSGVWILSFEPAKTSLHTGDTVTQGQQFAFAQGGSDHCADTCVHWGVRNNGEYRDPQPLTTPRRIQLLPVT